MLFWDDLTDVGEDDGLDGQPAHGTQLVPFLQLPGAHVAGHQVSRVSVNDAAVLRTRLTNETRIQTGVGKTPFCRNTALQIRDSGRRTGSVEGRWEELLGVDGGRRRLVVRSVLLRGRGRLGGREELLRVWG